MKDVDKYLSEEPWDDNQALIYDSISKLCDRYYYETGLLLVDYLIIDSFPICCITIGEEDPIVKQVIMYEIVNTIRDSLTTLDYHGTIYIDFYDLYDEVIGIFMEKI